MGTRRKWRAAGVVAMVSLFTTDVRADYPAAVLADSPLGYWRFDADGVAPNHGTGGDSLNGQIIGGQLVSAPSFQLVDGRTVTGLGAGNRAFEVGNEIDEYMTVEQSILNDLGEFSLEAWVNPGPRNAGRIGLFGQNDAVEFGFIAANQIQLWTPSGQVLNYTVDPVNEIPEDTWFHLGVVANGNNIRMFINGEPLTKGASYGDGSDNFNFGGGGIYDATGNQFTGALDEVAIWNKALSETQIQAQVSAGQAAGGGYGTAVLGQSPLGYWDMNDVPGDTAVNKGSGGAALNGTYVGGDRSVSGPNETYGGFATGNQAFGGEAPDDGYITVENRPLAGLSEFTVSGWVKPGLITDTRVGLFGQNDTVEFGLINPTTLQLWTPNGGSIDVDITGLVIEDEWVHIAAVGTGDELQIYVDGELMGSGGNPLIGNPIDSYGNSTFFFNVGGGGIYDGTGNQFTGQLDEVAVYDRALTDAQIKAHFEAALGAAGVTGDFNGNGELDAADLDLMALGIVGGDSQYDLTGDNLTNIDDRRQWINVLKKSYMGDSNLDGQFNSGDLVTVFTTGKFETGNLATWSEGDWNGDRLFNSSDFVEAFQGGGYEAGPRAAVSAVPEPSTFALMLLGLLPFVRRR